MTETTIENEETEPKFAETPEHLPARGRPDSQAPSDAIDTSTVDVSQVPTLSGELPSQRDHGKPGRYQPVFRPAIIDRLAVRHAVGLESPAATKAYARVAAAAEESWARYESLQAVGADEQAANAEFAEKVRTAVLAGDAPKLDREDWATEAIVRRALLDRAVTELRHSAVAYEEAFSKGQSAQTAQAVEMVAPALEVAQKSLRTAERAIIVFTQALSLASVAAAARENDVQPFASLASGSRGKAAKIAKVLDALRVALGSDDELTTGSWLVDPSPLDPPLHIRASIWEGTSREAVKRLAAIEYVENYSRSSFTRGKAHAYKLTDADLSEARKSLGRS